MPLKEVEGDSIEKQLLSFDHSCIGLTGCEALKASKPIFPLSNTNDDCGKA